MADNMAGLKRSAYCGEVTKEMLGTKVTLCGWCGKQRDLGNLVFIDLRDKTGICQLAFDDKTAPEILKKAASVRSEYVLMAMGVLRERESKNMEIPTGEWEIYVEDLRVLATSKTPPFDIKDDIKTNEELRLKYRFLDLRRNKLQRAMQLRHRVVKIARDYFDENRFLEIETPILIKSTPEGARDYLVPSRVHAGKFYALPQSPQLYKQLLMLSGFDRYMQIAKCFRDEDLRADRQPEFTQIDVEMSFCDENDVQTVNEGFMQRVIKEVWGKDLALPLPRMKYADAMENYGSDKPDNRFGLELHNCSDIFRNSDFVVFKSALEGGGSVRSINVKGAADKLTRKEIDKLVDVVKLYKAKGLAYTRFTKEGITSSFEKFLTEEEKEAFHKEMDFAEGDVLMVVADTKNKVVFDSLGALRLNLAKRLELIPKDSFSLFWVTDFPLFEYDEEAGRYFAMHHPFTCPNLEDIDRMEADPGSVRARAYDIILNGTELGGGSIRISDEDLQKRMFKALGMTEKESTDRFGFLLDAFQYGVPPHGGMAYGLDRFIMLLLNAESIRDVIAFPKVQNASELMSGAPDFVEDKSLNELSIAVTKKEEN
ncbi:MAG: aspartate--tRNA ligase [Oscillospiraceae bacterium]